MNRFFLIILIILFLAKFDFSLYEQDKFYVSQYYDITFKVYKYSDEDRLNCKEFFYNKKGELLLKKSITVWEDTCYIEEYNGFMDSDQNGSQFKVYLLTIKSKEDTIEKEEKIR